MTELAAVLRVKSAAERWQALERIIDKKKQPLDPSTLTMLVKALGDEHPFVRWQAGLALANQPEGRQKLIDLLQNPPSDSGAPTRLIQASAADALSSSDHPAVHAALIQALNSPDPLLRQNAAEALANQKTAEAVPALIKSLQDTNLWVRRAAAYALGHLGHKEAGGVLLTALEDPSVVVRRSVIYALGALKVETALPQFKQLLKSQDPVIRRNAAWALGRIGAPAQDTVPALNALLDDSALSGAVAVTAQQAIDAITKPRWMQLLFGLQPSFAAFKRNKAL